VLAALAGVAIDRDVPEGVDRPIAPILGDRVPAEADPRVNEIRVGHLLAMRAGPERTSGRNHGRWVASPDRVRFALSRPFVDAPGGGMLHSTGSSHLLSAVLTRASGRATRSGTGLADRVRCQPGSATDLPFAAGNFDLVTLLHVGMNVPDKARPCAETARVPRPGGRFAVCDVMRTGEGALAGYRLALEVFGRMRARYAADEPPPGPHLVPGAEAPRMVANMIAGLERGIIAPVERLRRRQPTEPRPARVRARLFGSVASLPLQAQLDMSATAVRRAGSGSAFDTGREPAPPPHGPSGMAR
jgi:SAM-dependent methyltransferase